MIGYIDSISGKVIHGWAYDDINSSSRLIIQLYSCGELVQEVKADRFRADLLYSDIGDGYHAFEFIVDDSVWSKGNFSAKVSGTEYYLENPQERREMKIYGHVDQVNTKFVSGWAANIDSYEFIAPIAEIFTDNQSIATVSCDLFRDDLVNILPSVVNGRAGFIYYFPESLNIKHDSTVSVRVGDLFLPESQYFIEEFLGQKIFFMHIPKTAGTTFNNIMQRRVKRSISHIEACVAWKNKGYISRFQFVSGHMRFIDFFESHDRGSFKLVTILRNPYRQFISNIVYMRKIARDDYKETLNQMNPALREFIYKAGFIPLYDIKSLIYALKHAPIGLFDNVQTRYLLPNIGDNLVTEDLLNEAKSNVKYFDYIGFSEEFKKFLHSISDMLSVQFESSDYSCKDNSGSTLETLALWCLLRNHAKEFIWADIELYKYCKNKRR